MGFRICLAALAVTIFAILEGSYREYLEISGERAAHKPSQPQQAPNSAPGYWDELKYSEQREVSVFRINGQRVTGLRSRNTVILDQPLSLVYIGRRNPDTDEDILTVSFPNGESGSLCALRFTGDTGDLSWWEGRYFLKDDRTIDIEVDDQIAAAKPRIWLLGWEAPVKDVTTL